MRSPYTAIGGLAILAALIYLAGYELWQWIGAMF